MKNTPSETSKVKVEIDRKLVIALITDAISFVFLVLGWLWFIGPAAHLYNWQAVLGFFLVVAYLRLSQPAKD